MATVCRGIASRHTHITISKVGQSFGHKCTCNQKSSHGVGLATPTNNEIIFQRGSQKNQRYLKRAADDKQNHLYI